MSQSLSKMIFETTRLLAFKLANKDAFFEKTACMDVEDREYIAYCEIYKLLFPNDKEFNGFLDNVVIPAFQRIGNARWMRTEITDLGLKVGMKYQTVDLSYLEKQKLEDEAEKNEAELIEAMGKEDNANTTNKARTK
jgi:hypothetical protein